MEQTWSKQDVDALKCELQACRRKLNSKCEALLILSKDLDKCRQERDQFQLMAEQVQSRYQSIKRQLAGIGPRMSSFDGVDYNDMKHQNLAQLLCHMRDANKTLQFEVDDLKQKLKDSNGDIKLLREHIARQRVGTTDEAIDVRHFPAYERHCLVEQLESMRNQHVQLERDLQQVVDEKEELVTERDMYRVKYDRLNKELNYILKGDERRVLDVDALIMENRYLQERIRQVEEEHGHAMETISKYKNILEKKKSTGILKLGQNRSGGVVVSQRQVHQLLESSNCMAPTPQTLADLQSLACALLESLNDKNVALSLQRKTNKILGLRVAELEKKLKTLEMTGFRNDMDHSMSLDRLRSECSDIRAQVEGSSTASDTRPTPSDAESPAEDDETPNSVDRSTTDDGRRLVDVDLSASSTSMFAEVGSSVSSLHQDNGHISSSLHDSLLIDLASSTGDRPIAVSAGSPTSMSTVSIDFTTTSNKHSSDVSASGSSASPDDHPGVDISASCRPRDECHIGGDHLLDELHTFTGATSECVDISARYSHDAWEFPADAGARNDTVSDDLSAAALPSINGTCSSDSPTTTSNSDRGGGGDSGSDIVSQIDKVLSDLGDTYLTTT